MARTDFENSPESGQPVSLFLFRYGPGASDYYAYTDAEAAVTHDSIVYSPASSPEQLDDIESKQKLDSGEVRIRLPLDCEVIDLFSIYPPTQVVTLTIREGHVPNADDPGSWASGENFPVAWLGRILEVEREDDHAIAVCDNSAASMRRPGLRHHYQYSCRHIIYRGRCRAVKATHETSTTVSSVTVNRVVLSGSWVLGGFTELDYHKGLCEWDGPVGRVVRTIQRVEGTDTLVLNGPATDLAASDTVDLYVGCPKTIEACIARGAINAYGGCPGIPKLNPTGKNNHT